MWVFNGTDVRLMTATTKDKSTPKTYSLPVSMHERLAREAEAQDEKKSAIVRKALRFFWSYEDAQRHSQKPSN